MVLTIYGKNPPHWRMDRVYLFRYLATVAYAQPRTDGPDEKSLVTEVMKHFAGMTIQVVRLCE